MIQFAEAVLPGHPDKLCDRIADAIVAEALSVDPSAFAQIEVGVWQIRHGSPETSSRVSHWCVHLPKFSFRLAFR
jgi:hypothetical protein